MVSQRSSPKPERIHRPVDVTNAGYRVPVLAEAGQALRRHMGIEHISPLKNSKRSTVTVVSRKRCKTGRLSRLIRSLAEQTANERIPGAKKLRIYLRHVTKVLNVNRHRLTTAGLGCHFNHLSQVHGLPLGEKLRRRLAPAPE